MKSKTINKSSEDTQKLQNQKSNNQLLSSEDQSSFYLMYTKQNQDAIKTSLLNQENLIFNSRICQEYIKNHKFIYHLDYNDSGDMDKREMLLVIFNTKSKREKIKVINRNHSYITRCICFTQLPNGDLFYFGENNNHINLFLIDRGLHTHTLPSSEELMSCSSAIYYNRSVYCFGGYYTYNWECSNFSKRFDLDQYRWINLSPIPNYAVYCNTVIFKGNILISNPKNINLWIYSIDIDSFSTIPYEFQETKKVMVNAEERLYLFECTEHWFIYESEIWDEFSWKLIINLEDPCSFYGFPLSGIYNKKQKSVHILSFDCEDFCNLKRIYWKFNLNTKALNEEKMKKCRIF